MVNGSGIIQERRGRRKREGKGRRRKEEKKKNKRRRLTRHGNCSGRKFLPCSDVDIGRYSDGRDYEKSISILPCSLCPASFRVANSIERFQWLCSIPFRALRQLRGLTGGGPSLRSVFYIWRRSALGLALLTVTTLDLLTMMNESIRWTLSLQRVLYRSNGDQRMGVSCHET